MSLILKRSPPLVLLLHVSMVILEHNTLFYIVQHLSISITSSKWSYDLEKCKGCIRFSFVAGSWERRPVSTWIWGSASTRGTCCAESWVWENGSSMSGAMMSLSPTTWSLAESPGETEGIAFTSGSITQHQYTARNIRFQGRNVSWRLHKAEY